MNHNSINAFELPQYTQLHTSVDSAKKAVWHYLNPEPRPCFTPTVLSEIADLQARVQLHRNQSSHAADDIRYLIMASAIPSVYNLGGDLGLFAEYIAKQDRDGLRDYAYRCVDCVIGNALHLGQPGLTTISLVQGKALGGGFEAALSCNVMVAERGVQFGFPEVMFNLFPGMGAYSLLRRRIAPALAERLIRSGDQYSAETLYDMGVVDVLANKGEGVHAVYDYIRSHERARNGFGAIQQMREWNNPLTREELIHITDMWVDNALQINERDMRTMARLTAAQFRLAETSSVTYADRRKDRLISVVPNVLRVQEENLPAVSGL